MWWLLRLAMPFPFALMHRFIFTEHVDHFVRERKLNHVSKSMGKVWFLRFLLLNMCSVANAAGSSSLYVFIWVDRCWQSGHNITTEVLEHMWQQTPEHRTSHSLNFCSRIVFLTYWLSCSWIPGLIVDVLLHDPHQGTAGSFFSHASTFNGRRSSQRWILLQSQFHLQLLLNESVRGRRRWTATSDDPLVVQREKRQLLSCIDDF